MYYDRSLLTMDKVERIEESVPRLRGRRPKQFSRIYTNWIVVGFTAAILLFATISHANIEYYPDAYEHETKVKDIVSTCEGRGVGVVGIPTKRKPNVIRHKRHQPSSAACHPPKHRHRKKKKRVRAAAKAVSLAPTLGIEPVCEPGCDGSNIIIVTDCQHSLKCWRKPRKGNIFTIDPLPACFRIYVDEKNIPFLHYTEGFEERCIPVLNDFLRTPGCYVACYSHNPDKSVYSVAANIYMIGYIRVRGNYIGKTCVPENYENTDIKGEKHFKELCSKSFSCIGNSCWADGTTGFWFGL